MQTKWVKKFSLGYGAIQCFGIGGLEDAYLIPWIIFCYPKIIWNQTNYVGPIILFYQKQFWTQGLTLGKPHPIPFFKSSHLKPKSYQVDHFHSWSCNVLKLHEGWGRVGGHAEFWEASKFYKVWIDEGFQQVFGVFEKGFP